MINDLISILKNVNDPIHIWDHPILNESILCLIHYNAIPHKTIIKYSDIESVLIPRDLEFIPHKEDFKHSITYMVYIYSYRFKHNTINYDIADLEAYVRKLKIDNLLKL